MVRTTSNKKIDIKLFFALGAIILFISVIRLGYIVSRNHDFGSSLDNPETFIWFFSMLPGFIIIFVTLSKHIKYQRQIDEVQSKADKANIKAKNLPKAFNYYCPKCLLQTNKYSKRCPSCKYGTLKTISRR